MKKIYLVQKMEREEFQKWARKGVKVNRLDCYGQVITMWCECKKNALKECRSQNRKQKYEVFFINQIKAF